MTTVRLSNFRPIHQVFMTVTLQRYRGMVARFAERRDKRNRVYRLERQIPFTLDQFRAWMIEKLNGEESGCIQCRYCGQWLTIGEIAIDHRIPVALGGSLELDNLDPICAADNQRKGLLSVESYLVLIRTLDKFPAPERRDVIHRLEIATQLAAKTARDRKRAVRAEVIP